ncbi:MAG: GDP-mannose 4,6-dehydratase [Acidobacteria bacterium]|uniref:GDP-mannose 4,6-dehydratase n=1 Tax=Candidatus Polarisedimenticola svalbardensis TaxID=2886004 RepID=A0A8J6XY47_9BACT|nr:GDP-mannose 4,6-dehydratase [Candidatus Polarisedimenticola svalbardensis]
MRTALIAGVTGQDGSYLADLLLAKGYQVHGIIRRASTLTTQRVDHIYEDPHNPDVRFRLHYGDLTDGTGLRRILEMVRPDEVYNLAAQSHVRVSFDQPEYTADVVATGALRLLEAIRDYVDGGERQVRYFQASSSEMYGTTPPPQNETSRFHPRSPYAASKVAAYWYTVNYREAYGLYAVNGILFNHESPRRGETFVTRKITRAVGRIKLGLQDKLYLGNLDARRDWGFAGDYVDAMWRMLQAEKPADFVVASGESRSVREFLEAAFGYADLDWQKYVEIDPRYFRPAEVDDLRGDASRLEREMGWKPVVGFTELVRMMVDSDLELARQEQTLKNAGHDITGSG